MRFLVGVARQRSAPDLDHPPELPVDREAITVHRPLAETSHHALLPSSHIAAPFGPLPTVRMSKSGIVLCVHLVLCDHSSFSSSVITAFGWLPLAFFWLLASLLD